MDGHRHSGEEIEAISNLNQGKAWNNLAEDRVRYMCSIAEYISTSHKPDIWDKHTRQEDQGNTGD